MVMLRWKAGAEQYPPDELLDYAIAAENAGFEAIDVSDHFSPWSEEGQASFCWTWLGAVAARTQRIQMGTGLTCPILRYHPAIIAQAVATLEAMAPGRVFLAVGTGEALNEYAATGQWPDHPERQERMIEAFERGAREAGKDPSRMSKLVELNVAYSDDADENIECIKRYWAGTYVPALFNVRIYTPKDSATNGEVVGAEVIKQKMCLSANPDDHVRNAQQYIDLGFTHLFFHYSGPDQAGFLQCYGRDVLPRIRSHAKDVAA